jgi:predicted TIM-barrel fold metal-dependent hydrolase
MIDAHTHLHPPRLFAAIRRWFAEKSTWGIEHQPTEPADVAAALRAAGVERFIFFSYAHKPGMARDINEWLAQTARELGGAGIPLATVHPGDPEYVRDLELALDAGCAGLKLHEDVQRVTVDDPRLDPIYKRIAARGGVLLAHVGPIPWSDPIGGAARVECVVQRHPQLKVVVAHMGAPESSAYFALMARHANLYLDTTMAFAPASPFALSFDASQIAAHAGRILYGTDFPNIPYAYGEERVGLERLALSAPELHAILHDNAARLFANFW